MSFKVHNRDSELQTILENLKKDDMRGLDISDNEMAKSHARYLVGGKRVVENERLFRFGKLKKKKKFFFFFFKFINVFIFLYMYLIKNHF